MGLVAERRRGDLPETSYDAGLRYTRPPPFKVEVGQDGPLPPILQRHAPPSQALVTSSGLAHSGRPQAGWQVQTRCPKAPPHWTTHCLTPLAQRLKENSRLCVLSAAVSEARDSYRGLQAPKTPLPENFHTLMSLYKQLDSDRRFVEPPVSTAHASYRRFQRSELMTPSRLDVQPAYSAHLKSPARVVPPRPHHEAPLLDPSPSMGPLAALPLSGRSSEYRSSFCGAPPHVSATLMTPVSQTFPGLDGSSAKGAGPAHPSDLRLAVFAVPRMYAPESNSYGCGKPIVI
ncbi:hypothetical protein N1851_015796 [Merluccius polli]|uniref:Uncharacterized protein n=1 Tax=Merluccius polli TaxID=89951 RepID=A0AA47MRK2_MERPO|nr:hypothetical protein N1851_015796 [Merluccius polli]